MDLLFEQRFFKNGIKLIGSLDEAGRGPLAGPVVAACVVCNANINLDDKSLKQIRDSKKVSPKKREELYKLIFDVFPAVGVGITDHETVDRINVLEATFLAMKKAIGMIKDKPELLLIDGNSPIPNISIRQTTVIGGDSIAISIAAASIIAKVTRDRIMNDLHKRYPNYGFDKHKGYGTKIHMEQLDRFGPSPIHRRTFEPVKRTLEKACLGTRNTI